MGDNYWVYCSYFKYFDCGFVWETDESNFLKKFPFHTKLATFLNYRKNIKFYSKLIENQLDFMSESVNCVCNIVVCEKCTKNVF